MSSEIEASTTASSGREHFATRLGFIMVSAGCAIGLGNVWKFPYITGQYGGAAFVIMYLIFLVLFSVPIMIMEFAMGRGSQKGIARFFDVLEPEGTKWHWFKWVGLAGNMLLMMFYTMVAGWLIDYFFKAAMGQLVDVTAESAGAIFGAMITSPGELIPWTALVCVLGALVCLLGLKNGVERVTKFMMIGLLALILVLIVRAVTLPGASAGLEFYLKPDFAALFSNWSSFGAAANAALGHSFFTLSVGIGAMAIFGSYIGRDRTLTSEGLTVGLLDTIIALGAGLIIFPSCFAFGVQPDAGPSLILQTLPCIFAKMWAGRLWAALFFLFMSFAALSTVVAVFENIISFGMDEWGWSRKTSSVITLIAVFILSMPCVLGFNVWEAATLPHFDNIMDIEDFIISNNILPLGGMVFVMFCTWKKGWGWNAFLEEVDAGKGIRFPRFLKGWLKYGLPILLLIILVLGWTSRFLG